MFIEAINLKADSNPSFQLMYMFQLATEIVQQASVCDGGSCVNSIMDGVCVQTTKNVRTQALQPPMRPLNALVDQHHFLSLSRGEQVVSFIGWGVAITTVWVIMVLR